jgi:hypothetical protein
VNRGVLVISGQPGAVDRVRACLPPDHHVVAQHASADRITVRLLIEGPLMPLAESPPEVKLKVASLAAYHQPNARMAWWVHNPKAPWILLTG